MEEIVLGGYGREKLYSYAAPLPMSCKFNVIFDSWLFKNSVLATHLGLAFPTYKMKRPPVHDSQYYRNNRKINL